MPKLKLHHAFTLIELLVVMALIGIMAGIVTTGMVGQQKKARDAQRKSDLSQVKKALQSARNDCKSSAYYPAPGGVANENNRYITLMTYLTNSNLKYLSSTLHDPKWNNVSANTYSLISTTPTNSTCITPSSTLAMSYPGSTNYILRAKLEIPTDPDSASSYSKCSAIIPNLQFAFFPAASSGDGYYYVCND